MVDALVYCVTVCTTGFGIFQEIKLNVSFVRHFPKYLCIVVRINICQPFLHQ